MPSPDSVLTGLATIANDWRWLSMTWHVLLAVLFAALVAGWRPSTRLAGRVAVALVCSVSLVGWLSGNPFNGAVFALLAGVLGWMTGRIPNVPVHLARHRWGIPGIAFILFGWIYPHFLPAESWTTYAYAAPLGLLPCPTLSVVIGLTLVFENLCSRSWCTALVAAGLIYGSVGVFRLGVTLDWGLLFASAILAAAIVRDGTGWRRSHSVVAGDVRPRIGPNDPWQMKELHLAVGSHPPRPNDVNVD